MAALNQTTLARLPDRLGRPAYDRRRVRPGIAHLSVGNFHRAHQAFYLDRCLAAPDQQGWGICGVGVIDSEAERTKAAGLAQQDGIYTLTVFPPRGEPQGAVIGSIVEYLFAPADPAAAVARLSDPAIRIVSMTITEGGYNLDDKGQFRLDAPDVAQDLAHPDAPRTVFGLIAAALTRRRDAGGAPFTVLSCDNLRHNGEVARRAILAFAEARDSRLARWIEANVAFPSCMVDRITPAVTPADAQRLNGLTGIEDAVPVFAEDFVQWVIEDRFCNGRPVLEAAGVQFTADVGAYEQVKLRMLNASHSVLSFPGQLGGYRFVHEAMADPRILGLLRNFLDRDVIPQIKAPPGMAPEHYRDSVLARFSNPAINDQLPRITSDSGSKIPVFLGDTIRACLDRGGDPRRLAFTLAAFARYLAGADDRGATFAPQEPHLSEADLALAHDPDPLAPLRIGTLRPLDLDQSEGFAASFLRCREAIAAKGALEAITALGLDGAS